MNSSRSLPVGASASMHGCPPATNSTNRLRTLRNSVAALLSALTLALNACGGGSGSGSPSIPSQAGAAAAARRVPGTYKLLYSFGKAPDGNYPEAGLITAYGTLYGTTQGYGAHGKGTVFNITTAGLESVLYSFGKLPDGDYPEAGLIHVGRSLYGTTEFGGGSGCDGTGCGAVYSVTTSGQERVLYSFAGPPDGDQPLAGLIELGTTFYGTTSSGGTGCDQLGCGTVFSITPTGQENVLYSFQAGSDGDTPVGGLRNVKGSLYGTTEYGGATSCGENNGCGTVFEVTVAGQENVLYRFAGGADGWWPQAGLINIGGTLYGTTQYGGGSGCFGIGCGTVFQITTSGTESILYSFKGGSDGAYPLAGLLDVNGVLYGTTNLGGGNGCKEGEGCGTVFRLTTSGQESVLYSFKGGADGEYPSAGLTYLGGALYGTTPRGGTCPRRGGCGTVYSLQL